MMIDHPSHLGRANFEIEDPGAQQRNFERGLIPLGGGLALKKHSSTLSNQMTVSLSDYDKNAYLI